MVKSKVIGFVATKNPAKARDFYEKSLRLRFVYEDEFAVVFDANGTMLRVQKVYELHPAQHTVLGWAVDDIHTKIGELTKHGVRFERFEGLAQDERGVWAAPGGAKVAWFKDPDGNILSLTQFPE